jgi:hypothetical protein
MEVFSMNDKIITVIVNGREQVVEDKEISYEEIIKLAFGKFEDIPNAAYTIAYSNNNNGQGKGNNGILVKGDSLKIHKGVIFNVTRTDKS